MMKKEKKSQLKIIIKALKNVVKLRYLIIIVLLLLSNTYAWFIYSQTVQSEISTKVKAWKIVFKKDADAVDSVVGISVESIYPGMTDYVQSVTAYNESEVSATVNYKILELDIMGEKILTKEGAEYYNSSETATYTSADLMSKLQTDYPFKIIIKVDPVVMAASGGTSDVSITVNWPYESGNDELDTIWGNKAYEFNQTNKDEASINIKLMMSVDQNLE